MIRAITFDFWDTLVVDDSDEIRREIAGLGTKAEAREAAVVAEVLRHHPTMDQEKIHRAFDVGNDWARRRWKGDWVTPTVAQRLGVMFDDLKCTPTPGFDDLVLEWEEMERLIPPDFISGIGGVLEELSSRYRIGIISDTIVSPGRVLRQILERAGILKHFYAPGLIFSDEVGSSKPARSIFDAASAGLDVPCAEIIHIGDRPINDVKGAKDAGLQALLFAGVVDRSDRNHLADAVYRDHAVLPDLLDRLNGAGS